MVDDPTSVKELVALVDTMPSLPASFTRINDAVNDPNSTPQGISRLVETDQAITVRLLRLANTPMFGHAGKIETVNQAVMIIGTRQLRDLALATAVFDVFADIPGELVDMGNFWRHSLATGLIAKALVARRGEKNTERFFIAGLLHDVGSLVLYSKMAERSRICLQVAAKLNELLQTVEFRSMGFDHADVGGALLESWKLPASLSEPVANHHRFLLAARFPLENAVIHVSDIIANALDLGSNGEHQVSPLESAAWDFIRVPERHLGPIITEVERQFADVARVFLAK